MLIDGILDSLPDDPLRASLMLCNHAEQIDKKFANTKQKVKYYANYINLFAALEAYMKAINILIESPKLTFNNREEDIIHINAYILTVSKMIHKLNKFHEGSFLLDKASEKYGIKLGVVFGYKFTDGDLDRIQDIINELRDLIVNSDLFEARHRNIILIKLEKLQKSLHKTMSSLDQFWGFIGEAGVVMGKFGKDAKPFVDRIKEILQIVWRTQAHSEELPSETPLSLLSSEHSEKID